ncbi:response regulator [Opitutus sp. ER46]|uniref:response regulator n=1 Tax=Opitutus sp. ER46 TaxID=2161864 RepID=UPI000D2F87B3|nr:response regulator [Opitutus sp. ER46]PTY01146.1 hybrid sensor histidine kinase/response regulator [Opitutus sp. ER46]
MSSTPVPPDPLRVAIAPDGGRPPRTARRRNGAVNGHAPVANEDALPPTPAPAARPDAIEILLVDDQPDKLLALEAALTDLGETVVKAASGPEALRLVLRREFAVILLDINMPVMDGFETAALIRQRKSSAHTPIIFVTSFSTADVDVFRGYALGAVDYLFTPVTPEVLRSKVSVFVELAKKNREIQRQAEALRRAEEERLQRELDAANARIEWETRRNVFFRLSIELLAIATYDGRFTQVNPTWQKTLGYGADALQGCRIADFIHPDDAALTEATITNAQQADTPLYFESRFRASDGRHHWLGWTVAPFAAEGLLFVFARDITERREREDEIRRLNADLEQRTISLQMLNQELESFSYSLAHDLRTPLRSISAYSEMLAAGEAGELSPEVVRMVNTINRNSGRMTQLMDDFLAFFRVARKDVKQENIAMGAVAREAVAAVGTDDKRVIDVQVADLPAAKGDPAMVLQVFVNLISNAVKFTANRERARIEIGCVSGRTPTVYYVKDNGVGFNMKYYNRLFGVFERLHRREEFDGTGIGLAIVQKIVQRHGGAVWAEAVVDQGATFYFTLEPAPMVPEPG